jgi:hypothetical protein
MSKLSITNAWNETSAFVKHEAGSLFLIAFGLMTLPSIIFQVILQRVAPGFGQPGMAVQLGSGAASMAMLLVIPVVMLSLWGSLTINLLALRREVVIGSAFAFAARRLAPLIGASLLVSLAAGVASIPALIVVGAAAKSGQMGGGALLLILIMMLAFLSVAVRLVLMTPIAAAEPIGPIAIIRRSWELTSGHFWKLLGLGLLAILLFLVLLVAIGAVAGILIVLVLGRAVPGSLASVLSLLVSGVLQAGVGLVMAVMLARIYDQLAGHGASAAEVFK